MLNTNRHSDGGHEVDKVQNVDTQSANEPEYLGL
jgi:hypothetical protein